MSRLHPFYPVLPDAGWIARLVPLGVKLVQLRLKGADADTIRRQVDESLEVCARHGATLFVNDYWEIAIALGAPAVHLGQEDLATADRAAIRAAGLALGLSSHDAAERATALAAEPDYIALGPIYPTTLKKMVWAPHGLDRIGEWRAAVGPDMAIVAIGGITLERADAVWAAGANSIAVVTDIVTHPAPEARVGDWLAWAEARA